MRRRSCACRERLKFCATRLTRLPRRRKQRTPRGGAAPRSLNRSLDGTRRGGHKLRVNCAPTSLLRRTTTRRMTPKSKVRVDTRLNALAFAEEPAFSVHRKLPRPTPQNMYEGTNQMTKDEKWHEPPTEPAGRCTGLFFVLSGPTRPHTLHGPHKRRPKGALEPGSPSSRNHNHQSKCSAG